MTTKEVTREDWFQVKEWLLVKECSHGNNSAWDQLVHLYEPGLRVAVRRHLRSRGRDPCLIDDLVIHVWESLVFREYHRLRRFDRQRGGLATFLNCLARQAVLVYYHRQHSLRLILVPSTWLSEKCSVFDLPVELEKDEFLSTLRPRLALFCRVHLLGTLDESMLDNLSPANFRRMVFKVRQKCKAWSTP